MTACRRDSIARKQTFCRRACASARVARLNAEHRANRCNQVDMGSLWNRDRGGRCT